MKEKVARIARMIAAVLILSMLFFIFYRAGYQEGLWQGKQEAPIKVVTEKIITLPSGYYEGETNGDVSKEEALTYLRDMRVSHVLYTQQENKEISPYIGGREFHQWCIDRYDVIIEYVLNH